MARETPPRPAKRWMGSKAGSTAYSAVSQEGVLRTDGGGPQRRRVICVRTSPSRQQGYATCRRHPAGSQGRCRKEHMTSTAVQRLPRASACGCVTGQPLGMQPEDWAGQDSMTTAAAPGRAGVGSVHGWKARGSCRWLPAVPGLLQDSVDGRLLPVLHASRTRLRRSHPDSNTRCRGQQRRSALRSSASCTPAGTWHSGGTDARTPAALACRWPRRRQQSSVAEAQALQAHALRSCRQALPDSTHV